MTAAPAISVVIPTFNRAEYIVEAVESVLQQEHTGSGHEVIVIDDGSCDGTCEVLAPYESRIHYVFQENAGQATARNRGLQLARGEFVLFLDSDDALIPGALNGMLARFTSRNELGAVQGSWRVVNQHLETLFEAEPWHQAPQLNMETWVMNTPLFLGGMLCRRSWAESVGGFDTSLPQVEDVDFVLRLSLLGCEFAWQRRPVVLYRQHDDNITQNALGEVHAMERVYESLFERPELPKRIQQKKNEVFFYRNAWFAWRLCRSGCAEEVEERLNRSLACSAFSPQQTVLQWAKLFIQWSRSVGAGSEDLSALLPYMRSSIALDEEEWREMEQLLPWWASVWAHYLSADETPPMDSLKFRRKDSPGELVEMTQKSLLITPVNSMIWALDRFLNDARSQLPEAVFSKADEVSLYLTAFGQAAMARHPGVAFKALGRAIQHSGNPRALGAWTRFAGNALAYAFSGSKHPFRTWQ